MKEALCYEKLENDKVKCSLCPKNCIIVEGKLGFCNARKNANGKLYTLVYGNLSSIAIDSVEKKPLYHFLPGTDIFSVGTFGCNLNCRHCQNFSISRALPPEKYRETTPEQLVRSAIASGCSSIAYTYNEPVIFYEYVMDSSKLAKNKGIKNVIVSNGFVNEKPLRDLCKFIDGANIDLKAFNDEFYREVTFSKLQPVLDALIEMQQRDAEELHEQSVAVFKTMRIAAVALIMTGLVASIMLWFWIVHGINRSVNELRGVMVRMSADGDLSARAKVYGQDEIGQAATAFNGLIEGFANIIRQVLGHADTVSGTATQLSASSQQIAQGSQAQSEAAASTAAAVEEIKSGKPQEMLADISVDLPLEARIPQFFENDREKRIELYHQWALIDSLDELAATKDELQKQGALPQALRDLFYILRLKLLGKQAGIRAIDTSFEAPGSSEQVFMLKTEKPVEPKRFARMLAICSHWRWAEEALRVKQADLGSDWKEKLEKSIASLTKN